ncbi:P-loop containing nucleoside triphosphate hydrolase protein [Roridomyces roridus]|uniref:P-loop containing nucleoside triphosphate hydrolase protein n=1 Tax=Roridomyces roridus TaxID=1738132 RepID=A0AAD7FA88_9AGAR|nr:P-loop containing nucleoside triphosphate hydrolase protein [Roridomyces roridus]
MVSEKKEEDASGPPIQSMQLGVYRVVTEASLPFNFREQWKRSAKLTPTVLRLVKDIYSSSPGLFCLYLLFVFWNNVVDSTLSLHLSGRVLAIIEEGLKAGRPDGPALFQAVALRMIGLALSAAVEWCMDHIYERLAQRSDTRVQQFVLQCKLATDLTGVQANISSNHIHERLPFQVFYYLLQGVLYSMGAVTQLGYVIRLVRSTGHGPAFTLICIAHPILQSTLQRVLWSKPHIVEADNPHFLRKSGLRELSDAKYRQDIITGDIVAYVIQEFRRAVNLLGDTDISSPHDQYSRQSGYSSHLVTKLAVELPMLYYAVNSILNPTAFSLSTIATLHQSETLLSYTFQSAFSFIQYGAHRVAGVQALYDLGNVAHEMKDGDLPYPPLDSRHEQGMPFELKNVSFSYPGTTAKALNDITLSIKPGQLVVVVGSNGSGKSTIVKLLTRLYDATSGCILIDGQDIKSYRIPDLRQATATLTQDHHLYPLSLGENIGLGNPARVDDLEMIREAARQGGAEDMIAKLADGLGTVLERPRGLQWSNLEEGEKEGNEQLKAAVEKMKKEADVSGGERQRLVASRTFMRFTSNTVKLVCVDEPSSSLDPQAEWQLFNNLRQVREGKTMIFVTHRFGHLTKHADVILCMKEGAIIESGTHEELLELGGEYCKMFNIQAKAFD